MLALWPAPGPAFVLNLQPPGNRIPMTLSLGTTPFVSLDGVTTSFNQIARDALEDWNAVGIGPLPDRQFFSAVEVTVAAPVCVFDGVNTVAFRTTTCDDLEWGDILAIATRWIVNEGSGLKTVQADVMFNETRTWNAYTGPLRAIAMDLYRVAAHEFGHVLGLNHEEDVPTIMHAFVSSIDSLQADDADGAHAVAFTPPVPDLVVSALGNPPASAVAGQVITVSETTRNRGAAAAGGSTTRYYFSTDAVRSGGDRRSSTTRAVPGLAAQTESVASIGIKIPATLAPGSYRIIACADDSLVVDEADDDNNCRPSAAGMSVTAPNLVVSALGNPPAAAFAGGILTVDDTARNAGTTPAGASTTRYYLSLSGTRSGGDVRIGVRSVPGLAAGQTFVASAAVNVPAATPAATYFLIACADDLKAVVETSETDNCRTSPGTVTIGTAPDLKVTAVSISAASTTVGGSFQVTDTTANVGSAAAGGSRTRAYLSLDGKRSAGDIRLAQNRLLGPLAVGAQSSGSVSVTVPAGVTPATYFVIACADDTQALVEARENNNCRATATTLVVNP